MAKSAIFSYLDIFENGFLYRKVLIEYFQKMYRFNITGLTVDEINAFEISKKCQRYTKPSKLNKTVKTRGHTSLVPSILIIFTPHKMNIDSPV